MNDLLAKEDLEENSSDQNVIHAHFYPSESFIESLAKGVPDARERILALMEYDLKETHRTRQLYLTVKLLVSGQGWSALLLALVCGLLADKFTGNPWAAAPFVSLPLASMINALVRHDHVAEDNAKK